ncbi:MAG: glutamate--tRNA ligase [bacterium]|nr:glutamate--tRNA ligase [bacterium]
MTTRVRFAPSPTGYLHIGGARTALYNYLFARHTQGKFILRIEDTDELRSSDEAVVAILEGLSWLGLDWDEGPVVKQDGSLGIKGAHGPYFQMERRALYFEHIERLLAEGKAYECYCSTDELKAKRERAQQEKRPPKYDNHCRHLTAQQVSAFKKEQRKPVIRFKNSGTGTTVFKDIIKGEVKFENALLDDFVIVKPNGVPLYNLAVVLDDALMEITHVIRGDDHISNTPRQVMLYQALGFKLPVFAHIPMILGGDGSRLSKRHGAASVTAYRDQGYLKEAVLNYLALLGWSTTDSQQLFESQELIKKFTLERCSGSAAIFDEQKLLWMNGEYIRSQSLDEFTDIAIPYLKEAGLLPALFDRERLKKIIKLEQEKVKYLTDIPKLFDFMLQDEIVYHEKDVAKVLKKEGSQTILEDMLERVNLLNNFTADSLEKLCRDYADEEGIKTGMVFHPLRVATSGRAKGPSLFHYLEVLGKDVVCVRIEKALTEFFR